MRLRSKRGRPPEQPAEAPSERPHSRARTAPFAAEVEPTQQTTRSQPRPQATVASEAAEPPAQAEPARRVTRSQTRSQTEGADPDQHRPVTRSQTRVERTQPAARVAPAGARATGQRVRNLRAVVALRQRLRQAAGVVRALMFVLIADEAICLRVRSFYLSKTWTVALLALLKLARGTRDTLEDSLAALRDAAPARHRDNIDEDRIVDLLSSILAHVLLGEVTDFRPLYDKLSRVAARRMDEILGDIYATEISRDEPLHVPEERNSWFSMRFRSPVAEIDRSLDDMHGYRHVRKWAPDHEAQQARLAAFNSREEISHELSTMTTEQRRLTRERTTRQRGRSWNARDERAYTAAVARIRTEKTPLKKQKSRLLIRSKKYRLLPTRDQAQRLRKIMGTCRWTYNHGVAHFHKTHRANSNELTTLYVTEKSATERVYPEGMEPPPAWAFETPSSMRNNAMRALAANVKTAFKQRNDGVITHFAMCFSSKKKAPGFTFTEDARGVTITQLGVTRSGKPALYLSLTSVQNIRIRMPSAVHIDGEVDVVYQNGFWYAVIPEVVEPEMSENEGSCIGLDPGIKAFLTGVDLRGNIVEFARGNQERLDSVRQRQSAAQRVIDKFKSKKKKRGRAWRWEYRKYARAKRTFHSCTAKLKNLVKDLHHKASSCLTDRYDTILLPRFQTQSFIRRSSAHSHGFNRCILSLNHYQFRRLLAAKCQVKGNTLVECSEMYTSQTCSGCCRLHASLGSNDTFACPHCAFRAGRDVNAALNILRFVIAGSLQTFSRTTAGRPRRMQQ